MTFSTTTLSIITQHNRIQQLYFHVLVMLTVVMLTVVKLTVVMLSIVAFVRVL
jgi:hypothetical protein